MQYTLDEGEYDIKLRADGKMYPVHLVVKNRRMWFHFKYNKPLLEEIKTSFSDRKYHGFDDINPQKVWSAPITQRNMIVLEDLKDKYGCRPFARYDNYLAGKVYKLQNEPRWKLYKHQRDLIEHALTVRSFIWAAEMGSGKTLSAFVVMEESGLKDWWWVAPKGALRATREEVIKWGLRVIPKFITYDGLKKAIAEWKSGEPAPQGVIFDEGSRLKTPTSQRSVAAKHLADAMRVEHPDCIIGLLSGTPAPKSPADWWWECEVVQPGFLREGSWSGFKERLAITEKRDHGAGAYSQLVSWRDDPEKCSCCGKYRSDERHGQDAIRKADGSGHQFVPSINEVANLSNRLRGLVCVKRKAECLDLPAKRYEVISCPPSPEIIQAARLVAKTATSSAVALGKLRELSDGFQYKELKVGTKTCELCNGSKLMRDPLTGEPITCTHCAGTGEEDLLERQAIMFPCPKDDVLVDMLEEHEDIGRLVVYGGFQATIDRIIRVCQEQKWTTIRADGRGWLGQTPDSNILPSDKLLNIFSTQFDAYERVVFVGQPGAAGLGLNLQASPTIFFYSNDFVGENRFQAEDRGHRPGMDIERGGRIVDCSHLPTDLYVLNNLKEKKDLQSMSLGEIKEVLAA